MKSISLLLLAILTVALTACQNESPPPEEPRIYWGTTWVEKNGIPWSPYPSVSLNTVLKNKLNFSFTELDKYGLKREKCSITKAPTAPGTYPLNNTFIQTDDGLVGSHYFFNDDDFLLGYYDVLEADSSSFVTITSYDTITREVKGTFEATYIVKQRPYPGAPDTIRLRNGFFHTKVLQ